MNKYFSTDVRDVLSLDNLSLKWKRKSSSVNVLNFKGKKIL